MKNLRLKLCRNLCVMSTALICTQIALAQAPSLTSISAVSAQSPQVIFSFDGDIRSYTLSRYKIVTASRGVANTPVTNLASVSADAPKQIAVPLDFASLSASGADSIQISIILGDSTHPNVLTTPFYSLDLSFLKAIKAYQTQILSLQSDRENLQSQATQCAIDRSNLVGKLSPTQFDYQNPDLVGPTRIVLKLHTDVYATIRVTDLTTGRSLDSVGVDHHVRFENLGPSTMHSFKAVALDASGSPIPALTKSFTVSTPPLIPFLPVVRAIPSGPTTITATVNFDPGGQLPAGFKAYVVLHYRQQLDQAAGIYGQSNDVGDGGVDSNGIPKGTPYTGSHDFPITVAPGKTYAITYTAYDEYGDMITNSATPGVIVTTPAAPAALTFATPISITMNTNTGLTVGWSANRAIQSAEMSITFPDGTVVIPPIKKDTLSKDVSVSTDLSGLATLLDRTQAAKTSPIIKLSMSDGTNTPSGSASVSMSLTFVVASKSSGTTPIQKAANQVSSAAQKNKKVAWKDIVATGLGIVVKML